MGDFLLTTTCYITNNFGNRNVFVQQEIVFTIARFIRSCAGSQCQNSKQCQHNFFHAFSFLVKDTDTLYRTQYPHATIIMHFLPNEFYIHKPQ